MSPSQRFAMVKSKQKLPIVQSCEARINLAHRHKFRLDQVDLEGIDDGCREVLVERETQHKAKPLGR